MIPDYLVPQVTIAQLLRETDNPTLDRSHAVVIGPSYLNAAAEDGNLVWEGYQDSTELEYKYLDEVAVEADLPGTHTVDTSVITVRGRNMRFVLWDKGTLDSAGNDSFILPGTANTTLYTGDVLEYVHSGQANLISDTASPSVAQTFDMGRAPRFGDAIRVTGTGGNVTRKVTSLLGKEIVATKGTPQYAGATTLSASTFDITSTNNGASSAAEKTGQEFADSTEILSGGYFAVQRGTAPLTGGLRIVLDVLCTDGDATDNNAATSSFLVTANGVPVGVTPTGGGGDTNLILLFNALTGGAQTETSIDITHPDGKWATDDRVVIECDIRFPDASTRLAADDINISNYLYDDGVLKQASSLIFECTAYDGATGDYTFRISDTRGLATPTTNAHQASDEPVAIAATYDGVTITITTDTAFWAGNELLFHVGQKWATAITPPTLSTTQFDRIKLSGPIGDIGSHETDTVQVEAFVDISSVSFADTEPVLSGTNFTADADSVNLGTLQTAIQGYANANDSVKDAASLHGEVAAEWKALEAITDGDGLFAVKEISDIVTNVGAYTENSELGFGLERALSGSQGRKVYGLKTNGTSLSAFTDALTKLESAFDVYALVFLTDDEAIMTAASDHAERMSAKTIKRFRRVYVGTDSPGEYGVLVQRPDTTLYAADINAAAKLVTFTDDDVDLEDGSVRISPGDQIRFPGLGTVYTVDYVSSDTTVVVVETPPGNVSAATVELWAADTAANVAAYVKGRSGRLGANAEERRRISNIWIDNGYFDDGSGVQRVRENRFQACEIAGLRSAMQPHQSLTRTEVTGITDAPSMYTRFTPTLLDSMAANGVWIITQKAADGPVYVRHQVTTEVSKGSLYYEDSVGVNLDMISFALDDLYEKYIGKRNVNLRTLLDVKSDLLTLLNGLTQTTVGYLLGPQLVMFTDKAGNVGSVNVEIHPNFADRIRIHVILVMPLPLNNVEITLEATTLADGTVTLDTTTL